MNVTILGHTIGSLPAWVPIWVLPAALIHAALFLALIVPAWVGLARARAGGPLSLVLVLPIIGLLLLTPLYMNRVLPYAHWGRFWGILVLIPGINIFFLWIFAFAPWKRRYIPLDQDEEYAETPSGLTATGRATPRLEGRSREPAADQAEAPTSAPAVPVFTQPAQTIVQSSAGQAAPISPRTSESGTMVAGSAERPAERRSSEPRFGERRSPPMSGPPAEPHNQTMIAGQAGSEGSASPPVPPRSVQPAAPKTPPPSRPAPAAPPPRSRAPDRTLDVSSHPPEEHAEAATVRTKAMAHAGGRAWRLVGANDISSAIDFAVHETALAESDSGLLVGRSARADFVIEHDSVSRNHARFLLDRGALTLEDLDSMNGTWVDGQRLDPNAAVPLQPGSIVELGRIKLRVTGG